MQLLTKASLGLAVFLLTLAVAPTTKADTLTIHSSGFTLNNLGNDGSVPNGLDTLIGASSSRSHFFDGPGSFIATLNDLTFSMGFTGVNSPGSYDFTFSQLVTVNGQSQLMNIFGRIDIGIVTDTVHLLHADQLTFNFGSFTADVRMLPVSISGTNFGEFCDVLRAKITINDCAPVPEPATLTLLGLGLAGAAAKIRQRRKQARLNQS